MAEITVDCHLANAVVARAVESTVRRALADFAGTWAVTIAPAMTAPWLVITAVRSDGRFECTLLFDGNPQSSEDLQWALLGSLRGAGSRRAPVVCVASTVMVAPATSLNCSGLSDCARRARCLGPSGPLPTVHMLDEEVRPSPDPAVKAVSHGSTSCRRTRLTPPPTRSVAIVRSGRDTPAAAWARRRLALRRELPIGAAGCVTRCFSGVWQMMGNLARDVRFGIRLLMRNPGFTAVAVLAFALGIAANTAIFSVVYATLLAPLPYRDARPAGHGLVRGSRATGSSAAPADFLEWKRAGDRLRGPQRLDAGEREPRDAASVPSRSAPAGHDRASWR